MEQGVSQFEALDTLNFLTTFSFVNSRNGLKVKIVGCMELLQPVNKTDGICGVIYLQGNSIPIVDLRMKFGFGVTKISDESCIVMVEREREGEKCNVGIIVDNISDVFAIAGRKMENIEIVPARDNSNPAVEEYNYRNFNHLLMNIDRIVHNIDIDSFVH